MLKTIHKIPGFSTDIYKECLSSTKAKLNAISWIVLVTAILSASFMGIAFIILFDNFLLAISFSVIWWFFIIGFDRIIILGNVTKKLNIAIRVFAALVFALLHSFVVDSLIFSTEIEDLAKLKVDEKKEVIQKKYDNQINQNQNLILNYNQSLDKKNKSINAADSTYLRETDGTGGSGEKGEGRLAEIKKEVAAKKAKRLQPSIDMDSKAINDHNAVISQLKLEKTIELKAIDDEPLSLGLLTRTELLHEIVAKGSTSTKVFALTWFLLITLIECLPLIAKHSVDLKEYYEIYDMKMKCNYDEVNAKVQLESANRLSDLQSKFAVKQFEQTADIHISESEIALNKIKTIINQHTDACNYWFDKKVDLENKIKEEFPDLGQPLFERTKKKIAAMS